MKPFYQDESVTIYCGRMEEVFPVLPQVDAVITDPPYGETSLEWDQWPAGWPSIAAAKSRQLWCFGSLRMFWEHGSEFSEWHLSQDLVWEKHNGSGLHADRFRRVHEHVIHLYQGEWSQLYKQVPQVPGESREGGLTRGSKPAHFKSRGGSSGYEYTDKRLMRSVIPVRSCHGYAVHPTQKPEGIIMPLIEYSVPLGGIVLDPFMGSGTTLKVAQDMGRRAIGIDLSIDYCRIAVQRLSQKPLL